MPNNPRDFQPGPELMPRNRLADWAREYGLYGLSDKLNSPTSGVGMAVDAVGGLGNALFVQPAESFNRLMTNGYERGNPQSAEDAFNVAGASMVGGLAAPRPRGSIGMSGRPEGAVNAAGERQAVRAYRGMSEDQSLPIHNRKGEVWASSNPKVASEYSEVEDALNVSGDLNQRRVDSLYPRIAPLDFRFKNPLVVDHADNWIFRHTDGKTYSTDSFADMAKSAGHDGIIVKGITDSVKERGDTIAALQPGTTYSSLTGDLLYANGGRQGAAVGAAANAPQDHQQNPDLVSILNKYGLGHLLQPTDWARKMQPGDA